MDDALHRVGLHVCVVRALAEPRGIEERGAGDVFHIAAVKEPAVATDKCLLGAAVQHAREHALHTRAQRLRDDG